MQSKSVDNVEVQKYCFKARSLISSVLGFGPPFPRLANDPREVPVARAILQCKNGQMSDKELFDTVYTLSVTLRNEEMHKKQWNMRPDDYDLQDFTRYQTYLPEYRWRAERYLAESLGYAPDIRHALEAEIYVRRICEDYDNTDSNIKSVLGPIPKSYAMRLPMTVVKYREVFMRHGREEADKSPLVAVDEDMFRTYLNSKR